MAFLTKIRNSIKRYKNRDFRTSLQKEKQGKYLIAKTPSQTSRGKLGIFKKKDKRLSPFSRFIQDTIHTAETVAQRKQKFLGYIGIFLISASLYIIAYSSYFDVTPSKVLIESNTDGIDISIAYQTIENFYGRNVFLVNTEDIALELKKYQKNISHITIDRLYPNGLKIILESHPMAFKLHIPGTEKEWGLSENGILIPKSRVTVLPDKLMEYISEDKAGEDIFEYKEIMSEYTASSIAKISSHIETTWSELKIQSLQYFARENEVHISLLNGGKILIGLKNFGAKTNASNENIFLKNEMINLKTFIDNNRDAILPGNFGYIDARVPGKIFICRDKVACKKNLFSIYGDIYK